MWNYFEFGPVVQEDMSFKRFLILSSGSPPAGWSQTICAVFERGHHGEHSSEIIWNLNKGLRGDVVQRYFLSGALAYILFSGVEPFVQFWLRVSRETILWNYFEFWQVVQEMSFKRFLFWGSGSPPVWWTKKDHNNSPWAFGSGELKTIQHDKGEFFAY